MGLQSPPCTIYVHIPWCLRKCFYCDFYSVAIHPDHLDSLLSAYVEAMLCHLDRYTKQEDISLPRISSIFIGGGTPSLCSSKHLQRLLEGIQSRIGCVSDIEITVECNPETLTMEKLESYCAVGINRLSIGVQTFCAYHLKQLGRLHTPEQIHHVLTWAEKIDFKTINLDLMYGLPKQTPEQAYQDLKEALNYDISHLSWYQLTIEPNTLFGRHPPRVPSDEVTLNMEALGKTLMPLKGFEQYEISAYAKPGEQCQHNLNYWQFGDYLALGLGAHGKLTFPRNQLIQRSVNSTELRAYLAGDYIASTELVAQADQPLEFFMNQCRLMAPIPKQRFLDYTQATLQEIDEAIRKATLYGYLTEGETYWQVTPHGFRFLEDLLLLFTPPDRSTH